MSDAKPSVFDVKRAIDDLFRIREKNEKDQLAAARIVVAYAWDIPLLFEEGRREKKETVTLVSSGVRVAIPVHHGRQAPLCVRKVGVYQIEQPKNGELHIAHTQGHVARDDSDRRKLIVRPFAVIWYHPQSDAHELEKIRIVRGEAFLSLAGVCIVNRTISECAKGHWREWSRLGLDFLRLSGDDE